MSELINLINGVPTPFTDEEKAQREKENAIDNSNATKLFKIKQIRNQKLQETDFYALQDVSMSNEMKAWRQSLRDIPANHTTEEEYDLLLARETDKSKSNYGELTHSVWSKP